MRRNLPVILAIVSVPVGLAAYLVAGTIIQALAPGLSATFVGLFVPLFAAGICMIPFIAPWFDARAKRDLETLRAMREADEAKGKPPSP